MEKWYQLSKICAKASFVGMVMLVLVSAGFEGFLRWKGFLKAQPAPYPCVTGDPVVNHRFQPNCKVTVKGSALKTDRSAEYSTNSIGLRMGEIKPSARKVVLLGDSYAEGFGVSNEETLATLLEARWRKAGLREVQFVNGGVLGTSPGLQNLFYRKVLRPLRPHLVLLNLDFTDLGDEAYFHALADWSESGAVAFPPREVFPPFTYSVIYSDRSALVRFIHQEVNLLAQHWRRARTIPVMNRWVESGEALVDRKMLHEEGLGHCWKPYELMARNVAQTVRDVRADGGTVAIHMYLPGQFLKKYPDAPAGISFVRLFEHATTKDWSWNCSMDVKSVKVFERVAKKLGVPLISSVDYIQGRSDREALFFDRDAHWNERGVRVMADFLSEPLLKIFRDKN